MTRQQRPAHLSFPQLADLLAQIAAAFVAGDTDEANISFTIHYDYDKNGDPVDVPPGTPITYDVMAGYRVGNLMGQGGWRQVGEWVEE